MPTDGRLIVNDAGTLLSTCLAGYGIAQVMDFGTQALLAQGQLVELFPNWPDERFPLHAIHPSRHQVPAKVQAFLKFVVGVVGTPGALSQAQPRIWIIFQPLPDGSRKPASAVP